MKATTIMKSPSKKVQEIIEKDPKAWVEISKSGEYPREVHSEVLNKTFIIKKREFIHFEAIDKEEPKYKKWYRKLISYLING